MTPLLAKSGRLSEETGSPEIFISGGEEMSPRNLSFEGACSFRGAGLHDPWELESILDRRAPSDEFAAEGKEFSWEASARVEEASGEAEPQSGKGRRRGHGHGERFARVVALLTNWYQNPGNASSEGLSEFEVELVAAVLRRKLPAKESRPHEDAREAVERLLAAPPKSAKRTEENNKFIFKHTLKLMKRAFRKTLPAHTTNEEAEQAFFEAYFRELGPPDRLGFLDPRAKRRGTSLSLGTIRFVFGAKRFASEFLRFLTPTIPGEDSPLTRAYMSGIEKKLGKLFAKWERLFARDELAAKAQVLDYFRTSTQCKFPWSKTEIQLAIASLLAGAQPPASESPSSTSE